MIRKKGFNGGGVMGKGNGVADGELTLFDLPVSREPIDPSDTAAEAAAQDEWRLYEKRRATNEANGYADYSDLLAKLPSSNANTLTRKIMRHIVANGGQAERINVFGRPITHKEGGREVIERWAASQMTAGTADISATIGGRSVKIEVKIGRDYQSEAQKRYQRQIEAAGGVYYIARNYGDYLDWYALTFGDGAPAQQQERDE